MRGPSAPRPGRRPPGMAGRVLRNAAYPYPIMGGYTRVLRWVMIFTDLAERHSEETQVSKKIGSCQLDNSFVAQHIISSHWPIQNSSSGTPTRRHKPEVLTVKERSIQFHPFSKQIACQSARRGRSKYGAAPRTRPGGARVANDPCSLGPVTRKGGQARPSARSYFTYLSNQASVRLMKSNWWAGSRSPWGSLGYCTSAVGTPLSFRPV